MQGQRCAAVRKSCRRCAAVKCPGVLLPNPPHPPPLRARTSALPSPSAPRLPSLTCTPAQRVCPPCHSPQASAGPLSPPACQHTSAGRACAPLPPSTSKPAHFSSALGCHIILASAPLRTSPRTSGPRPIPRAQFLSLAPHAHALQLGPRVPNHPRPGPPPCTPTHLRASAHPARTFSLRRRRCRQKQCEP